MPTARIAPLHRIKNPLLACVMLVAAVGSNGASAQQAKRDSTVDYSLAASARVFFKQGIAFADKRQWALAADRFRRAMRIRRSPVIAYNLAVVLDELGQFVEAAELLHEVADSPEAEGALRDSTVALIPKLEAKFATLEIIVENDPGDSTVELDDAPLKPVQIGAPIPVDPGPHVVTVLRRGRVLDRQEVEATGSGPASVTLSAAWVPTPAEVARAEAARQADQIRLQEPAVTERWWFWASVGAVTVGAVAVAAIVALDGSGGSTAMDDSALSIDM